MTSDWPAPCVWPARRAHEAQYFHRPRAGVPAFLSPANAAPAARPESGRRLANYYKLSDWLTIDADLAFAQARFKDNAAEGRRIPGAVEGVASLAVALDNLGPWSGALRLRYFGPRPLSEDNTVRSKATTLLNWAQVAP